MSVVHLIDTVTEWARHNICEQVKLKQPPEHMDANDAGYQYTLVTPAAFAVYTPTADKLPQGVSAPFPSLCVRLLSGKDNLSSGSGTAEIQFCFSTWDTGLHGKDVFYPDEDKPGEWKRWSGAQADAYFARNGAGWRDVWNFVDVALRALESVTQIGGYAIDRSQPIQYGPLTEQESIPDFYPFWFAWVSFKITYPLVRNTEDFQKFL